MSIYDCHPVGKRCHFVRFCTLRTFLCYCRRFPSHLIKSLCFSFFWVFVLFRITTDLDYFLLSAVLYVFPDMHRRFVCFKCCRFYSICELSKRGESTSLVIRISPTLRQFSIWQDTKLYWNIKGNADKQQLHDGIDNIDNLIQWSKKWQMFNFEKCKCLQTGPGTIGVNYEIRFISGPRAHSKNIAYTVIK